MCPRSRWATASDRRVRLNRFLLALLSAAALGSMPRAAAAQEAPLRLVPVVPARALAEARSKGLHPAAAAMTPAEEEVARLRLERARTLLPIKRAVMANGPDLERGRLAERLAAWRRSPPRLRPDGTTLPDTVIRMAILRVDFLRDRSGTATTGNGRFDLTPPDTNQVPIDRAPRNRTYFEGHARALERYVDVQSYGHVQLQVDVWPAEEDSAYHCTDKADFGPWKFSRDVYGEAVRMMRTMFFAADSQSTRRNARIPWDSYDRYTIIHAGSDLQSDLRQDSEFDIPSFTVFVGDTDVVIFPDSLTRPIDRVAFVPETNNQDGYYGAINGVLTHENGHNLFGLADIYDINSGYPTCGYWTLMDSGNLVGSRVLLRDGSEIYATGLLPPSLDPFQRQFLGDALTFLEPASGDTLTLRSSQRHPDIARIGLSSDEYLLIENRYLSPSAAVELDQDPVTRVILGPKSPDRFEYDALLPGGGILVWKVDDSVIPFDNSLRINPDYGFNSNPFRLGLQVLEADGLDDLGDLGSPYILGSPLDPYQRYVNPVLSDSTRPNLIPNQGTRPHLRVEFLDNADSSMRIVMRRAWQMAGWPVATGRFPAGGPRPLAIDADGVRGLEVCWAGGASAGPDSASLFAVRSDGSGLASGDIAFAQLDHRVMPVMAAVVTGDATFGDGPSVFAATTEYRGAADPLGGRLWLVDHLGVAMPGWPVRPPSGATTPPMLLGEWPFTQVAVGCADGRVRVYDAAGTEMLATTPALTGAISGRLAAWLAPGAITSGISPAIPATLAAGTLQGEVAVFSLPSGAALTGWPRMVRRAGTEPEFLWLRLGGDGANAEGNCPADEPTLVVRDADRLLAYCPSAGAIRGWGTSLGDTLVDGLGAGDPDGDGFPEVLVQTRHSALAFINASGFPSPGWPKRGTREDFTTGTPPLALDLTGDARSEVVALNASGVIAALDAAGRTPEGWPLATGSGALGSMVAADLDRDGALDLVAPDRYGQLYAYSLPVAEGPPTASSWRMLAGDPARTSSLPATRTSSPGAATAGPLVRGSLKAYPNPARNQSVRFAYTLSAASSVEFRIVDASGHEVASFTRPGQRSDNVEVWDPGALPAGLYMARLRFSGPGGARTEILPVGLLR